MKTDEERAKRDQLNRLVIDGWNGGLTGGALANLHGITRNAVIGIVHRAKAAGVKVREGEVYSVKPPRPRNKPKPGIPILIVPSVLVTHRPEGNWQKRRPPPKLTEPPVAGVDPSTLWVGFVNLQNNAGCRYSLDAKLFCNAPGFPYCPEHKAIVNPPSAQRGGFKKLAKNYGGRV